MYNKYKILKKIMPETILTKDHFGAEFIYIPLNKVKAKNILLKNGFEICQNKSYLKKDDIYVYNNTLRKYLSISI